MGFLSGVTESLFGGSKGSQRSRSRTDPRVMKLFLENVDDAKGVAGALGTRKFAGFGDDYTTGVNMYRSASGPLAEAAARAGQAYSPERVSGASISRGDVRNVGAGSFLAGGVDQYMNPMTDLVVDRALGDVERSRQIAMQGVGDRAISAGAFGGDRHGIVEAETNRAYADTAADTAAALRSKAFTDASALQQADFDRAANVGVANQQADLAVAGQNASFGQQAAIANQEAGLLGNEQNLRGTALTADISKMRADQLLALGITEQELEQMRLDAERNLPLERQRIRNEALGINPAGGAGRASTSSGSTSSSPGFLSGLGGFVADIGSVFSG